MAANAKNLIQHFGENTNPRNSPSADNLMVQPGEPIDSTGCTVYMSPVMSLLYRAHMVHLALLPPTAVLATRMHCPTVDDLEIAHRLFCYLNCDPSSLLKAYVDTSHSVYLSRRERCGLIAVIGAPIVTWRCYKLPHVHLSSTAFICPSAIGDNIVSDILSPVSDISAVAEAVSYSYIIWLHVPSAGLGHHHYRPTAIFQDKISAVITTEKSSTSKRTKHTVTRDQFITEHVRTGVIAFLRCPTEEHISDLLSKPLPAGRLAFLLRIIGWSNVRTRVCKNAAPRLPPPRWVVRRSFHLLSL